MNRSRDQGPHRRSQEEEPHRRRNPIGRGNDGFVCEHCGLEVLPLLQGSYRNHCPACLWSRHVDVVPGDRAEACGGLMEPVGVKGSSAGGWDIVHRCVRCGATRVNRAALDDPRQGDAWELIEALSRLPLRRDS
ncbi:MAG: RNHCP domain-containing protein [Planctomycetes bacterium]|nr:RNHCP domain-containing protein [Planctomycetota bacterium]